MRIDEQRIMSLSQDLWNSALGLQLDDRTPTSAKAAPERLWSSCIEISGAWEGAIVIECTESIARHTAAMLLASDGETASADEIVEAMGELSQRLGKRMLPLFPEVIRFSAPTAAPGAAAKPDGHRSLAGVQMVCEGRPVRISVLERNLATAPQ